MGRGRKRGVNPGIPSHIEQAALPRGLYWGENRWFLVEPHPDTGRPRKRTVAYGNAVLSELHAIVEASRSSEAIGTLGYVCRKFRESTEYRELSQGTRDDYDHHADIACEYKLRDGALLSAMPVDRMSVPGIQRLVEAIAKGRETSPGQTEIVGRPSTANHVLRFLRRLFNWGIRMGYCTKNPAQGVRQVKEKADAKMPERQPFVLVLAFAKERAALPLHSKGSCPPYMPAVMILAYNARLRGMEVTELTDAHALKRGVRCNRLKGSRDNVTRWNEDMRWAWRWLREYRTKRQEAHKRPVPLRPDQRPLLVTQTGTPLARSTLKTAWQRLITAAIEAGTITKAERFALHGLKHRGITDTRGGRAVKQDAAGHVSPQMTDLYDHEVMEVDPPAAPEDDESAFSDALETW
ncbi:integrase [Lysobacter sp. CA199]|uniref:tyrosine-type recombinase/integrase n=1 Tax=Lysobacter sp. CA199 TaxID=3455608 RepID=UPI003F8D1B17